MSTILSQAEFEHRASAWADILQRASLAELQQLFEPAGQPRQTYVSFDLATTITSLLSTVSIAGVSVRFVLHKRHDDLPYRFGVVLFATDALGGRISAYYLNDPEPAPMPDKQAAKPTPGQLPPGPGAMLMATGDDGGSAPEGMVPFNLIRAWIAAWASAPQLSAAMFQTHYGPLQGYDFRLSDFVDPLFQARTFTGVSLRVIFDLKAFFPAYPENQAAATQTFGLVLRLHPAVHVADQLADDIITRFLTPEAAASHGEDIRLLLKQRLADFDANNPGSTGGSSYDQSYPNPPGGPPGGG